MNTTTERLTRLARRQLMAPHLHDSTAAQRITVIWDQRHGYYLNSGGRRVFLGKSGPAARRKLKGL